MSPSVESITLGSLDVNPHDVEEVRRAVETLRTEAIRDIPMALDASARLVSAVPTSSPARCGVLALRGHVLCYANDFQSALAVLDEAYLAARRADTIADIGNVELARVQAYARLGRLAEAESSAKAAYESFTTIGSDELAGKAAANLAITLRMTGKAEQALYWFERAAAVIKHPGTLAALQSNRAEVYRDLDRFDLAKAEFVEARSGFDLCGLPHAAAIVEGNLAELHARMGEIDTAIRLFESAHERFEQAAAPADAARLLAEHGDVVRNAGAHRRAARIYQRAIPTLQAHGLVREAARAEMGLGACMHALGRFEIAATRLRAAVDRAMSVSDPGLLAECTLALAGSVSGREPSAAAELIRNVIPSLESSPLRLALALCELSEVAPTVEERSSAIDRASIVAGELALSPLTMRCCIARARLLRDTGFASESVASFREAITMAERIGSSMAASHLRSAFSFSIGAVCEEASECLLSVSENAEQLWELLERGSADHASSSSDDQFRGDAELQRHRDHLRTIYAKLGTCVWQSKDTEDLRLDLAQTEDRMLRRLDLLGGSRPDAPARLTALSDVQGRLGDDRALVVFFTDSGNISALCVTGSRAAIVRCLMPMSTAASLLRRARLHIDASLSGNRPVAEATRRSVLDVCAEQLAQPIFRALGGQAQSISIAPVGPLHGLPIAAAFLRLGVRSVSSLPGSIAQPSAVSAADDGGVLVVGFADANAPSIEHEACAVARHYRNAELLVGPDASADRVLSAVRRASLVHLASHAAYDAEFPLSSRFLIADRWVTARELASAIRPGSVIVLSGCDAARADESGEAAPAGLARAVLNAGARAVVGSLWAVDDATATGLFDRIHARIAATRKSQPEEWTKAIASIVADVQSEEHHTARPWPFWAGIGVWSRVE